MAITRTAMIDDDGSGTTGTILNNAWKQELYSQIDAFVLNMGTVAEPWVPLDVSGAGLVFSINKATYVRRGNVIDVWAHITYPATANGAAARIGGLPFANSAQFAGFYQTFGPSVVIHLPATSTAVHLLTPGTMTTITNAAMSGAQLIFQGNYFIP
jgi:hypothetical protein